MRVLYIDSLFFFELAADVTLLWAAGKLCAARRPPLRLLLGGVLGGLYAAAAVLWPPAASLPCRAAALAAMLLAAYGGERRLWRLGLAFLCMSAVYAGVATAISLTAGKATLRALVVSLGLSLGLCALPFRFSGKKGGQAALRLTGEGGEVCLTALRDTGNRLREPISGGPVLIAEEAALLPLVDAETRETLLRTRGIQAPDRLLLLTPGFRLLPYRTLAGNGLLLAFRPKEVYVDGAPLAGCWAALSPEPLRPAPGCSALINGDLE